MYDILEESGRIPLEAHTRAEETADAMVKGLDALAKKMKNVLEFPAFCMVPEIECIKNEIAEAGAEVAMMSGSGATVFGIFKKDQKDKVLKAREMFNERGWFTFICDFETLITEKSSGFDIIILIICCAQSSTTLKSVPNKRTAL